MRFFENITGSKEVNPMSDVCKNCKCFVQHYLKERGGYTKICFGHCIQATKVKSCKPDARACELFQKGEPQ